MGWVLRTHTGEVTWIGAKALPRTRTVIEVEAEALRWVVTCLARFQYKRLIFESDSKELISSILGEERKPQIDPLVQDIKQLLQRFDEVKFMFSHRGGNKVADRIARESLGFQNHDTRLYSIVPLWLKPTVENDLCNIVG